MAGDLVKKLSLETATDTLRVVTEMELRDQIGQFAHILANTIQETFGTDLAADEVALQSLKAPTSSDIDALKALGLDITPEGVIYEIADVTLYPNDLEVATYYTIMLAKLRQWFILLESKGGDRNTARIDAAGDDPAVIHLTNAFIKLMLLLWRNYVFTQNKEPISRVVAFDSIINEVCDGLHRFTQQAKFNLTGATDLINSLKLGALCEFVAHLIYEKRPGIKRVKQSLTLEEQLELEHNHVDLIVQTDRAEVIFVQVKTLPAGRLEHEDADYVIIEDPDKFYAFIAKNIAGDDHRDDLARQFEESRAYAQANNARMQWIFVNVAAYKRFDT